MNNILFCPQAQVEEFLRQSAPYQDFENLLYKSPLKTQERQNFQTHLKQLRATLEFNHDWSDKKRLYQFEEKFQKQAQAIYSQIFLSYPGLKEVFLTGVYQTLYTSFFKTQNPYILKLVAKLDFLPRTDRQEIQKKQGYYFLKEMLKHKGEALLMKGYEHQTFSALDYHLFLAFLNDKKTYLQLSNEHSIFIDPSEIKTFLPYALSRNSIEYSLFLSQTNQFSLSETLNALSDKNKSQLYIDAVAHHNVSVLQYLENRKFFSHKNLTEKAKLAQEGLSQLFSEHNGQHNFQATSEFGLLTDTLKIVLSIVLHEPKATLQSDTTQTNSYGFLSNQKIKNICAFLKPVIQNYQNAAFSSNPSVLPNAQLFFDVALDLLIGYTQPHPYYKTQEIELALEHYLAQHSGLYDYSIRETVRTHLQKSLLQEQMPYLKSKPKNKKENFKL